MRLARVYQVNPDLKKQLAQAFGVGSEAELEALIAKLRAGDERRSATHAQGLPRVGRPGARVRSGTGRERSAPEGCARCFEPGLVGMGPHHRQHTRRSNLFWFPGTRPRRPGAAHHRSRGAGVTRRPAGVPYGDRRRGSRRRALVPGSASHASCRWSLGLDRDLRRRERPRCERTRHAHDGHECQRHRAQAARTRAVEHAARVARVARNTAAARDPARHRTTRHAGERRVREDVRRSARRTSSASNSTTTSNARRSAITAKPTTSCSPSASRCATRPRCRPRTERSST